MSHNNYEVLQDKARAEFVKYYDKTLDLTEGKAVWIGQPVYVHENVETTWRGFRDAYILLSTRKHDIEEVEGDIVMSAQVNDSH